MQIVDELAPLSSATKRNLPEATYPTHGLGVIALQPYVSMA